VQIDPLAGPPADIPAITDPPAPAGDGATVAAALDRLEADLAGIERELAALDVED
jgi:hypothetical protein